MVAPLSAVSVKNGRIEMLVLRFVPQHRVHIRIGMGTMGVHVVVAQDADITVGDDGADRIFALEVPVAVLEELRVLLARGRSVSRVLVEPFLALGQTIGCERRIGLDRVVEKHACVDVPVLDGGVRLGVGGEGGRGQGDRGDSREDRQQPGPHICTMICHFNIHQFCIRTAVAALPDVCINVMTAR